MINGKVCQFYSQNELFKTILGSVLGLFCCYYLWLPWCDPKLHRSGIARSKIVFVQRDNRAKMFL